MSQVGWTPGRRSVSRASTRTLGFARRCRRWEWARLAVHPAIRRPGPAQFAEANSKRVPTLFWMNASGKRAARAWVARQPVQWHGTR